MLRQSRKLQADTMQKRRAHTQLYTQQKNTNKRRPTRHTIIIIKKMLRKFWYFFSFNQMEAKKQKRKKKMSRDWEGICGGGESAGIKGVFMLCQDGRRVRWLESGTCVAGFGRCCCGGCAGWGGECGGWWLRRCWTGRWWSRHRGSRRRWRPAGAAVTAGTNGSRRGVRFWRSGSFAVGVAVGGGRFERLNGRCRGWRRGGNGPRCWPGSGSRTWRWWQRRRRCCCWYWWARWAGHRTVGHWLVSGDLKYNTIQNKKFRQGNKIKMNLK